MSDSVLSETREQARERLIEVIARAGYAEDAIDHMTEPQRIGAMAQSEATLDALLRPELRVSLLTLLGAKQVGWHNPQYAESDDEPIGLDSRDMREEYEGWTVPIYVFPEVPSVFVEEGQ